MIERSEKTEREAEPGSGEKAVTVSGKRSPSVHQRPGEPGVMLGDVIAQAKLSVGPAGDAYEKEADDVASRVVRALRSGSVETRDAAIDPRAQRRQLDIGSGGSDDDGEGLDTGGRLRRVQRAPLATAPHGPTMKITRIQRAAPIGSEGGALDDDTSRMLAASRSGGRALPDEARSKMESAFGADFSGIRVHSGSKSTELNDRIQAKAFTTGKDIYFRDSLPDVSSSSGQELLAHELTHTIQQGAAPAQRELALHRTVATVQRWPWSKKKKKKGLEIGGPTGVTMNGGDMSAGLAAQGWDPQPIASPKIGIGGPMGVGGERPAGWYAPTPSGGAELGDPVGQPVPKGFKKHAAGAVVEKAKPLGVGGAAMTSKIATSAAGGGSSGANPVVGAALLFDGLATMKSGRGLKNEGVLYDDAAAIKKGNRKVAAGEVAVGAAAISSTKAGLDIANVATSAADATREALAATAYGAAGAGLGIAAGSVLVAQGAWRGGDAFRKVCRLQWGRAQTMLSERGALWKRFVTNREAAKIAINATKVALGALGIAAGILILSSNPIGWGISIAAGVAGLGFAIIKIREKINNASAKDKARKEIEAGKPPKDVVDADSIIAEANRVEAAKKAGKRANPTSKASKGDGSVGHAVNDYTRQQAIASASEVARRASDNGRIADEMRSAMMEDVDRNTIQKYMDVVNTPSDADGALGADDGFARYQATEALLERMSTNGMEFIDASLILESINVSEAVAVSASGLDIIETKLTLAEAM